MTNKQLTSADIDRVENLSYTPLEKAYLKVLMVKTIFSYPLIPQHYYKIFFLST